MEFKKFLFFSFAVIQIQISAGQMTEGQPKDNTKKDISVAPLIIYNWMKYTKCLKLSTSQNNRFFSKKSEEENKCFRESIVKHDSVKYSEKKPVYLFRREIAKRLNKQEEDIVLSASTKVASWSELYGFWKFFNVDIDFERIAFKCNTESSDLETTIQKAIGDEDPDYDASIKQFEVGIRDEETQRSVAGCVIS